jgi:nucleoside-diphosphate-sugar epimerase
VGDSFYNVSEAIDVNSKGTVNLMEAYDKYERFIYISSSEVYGYQKETPFTETQTPFPVSPYSVGKYSGELYARMRWHVFKDPVVVLRPFNAFGPYQSPRAIIAELIMKCLRGEDIATTGGIQTRDFNYVENLIDGFMLAAVKNRAVGQVINIGSGRDIPIKDLVRKIHNISASRSKLFIGKLPYRPTEIWRMKADNRKAARLLGWKPRFSLEEGLAKTVDWFRKFNDNFSDPDSGLNRLCATD